MASHCHQVKDKRLSLIFKAPHSLCLPTAPLCFRPIHPPSAFVLPAARSSPYRPHLCGPKSSHRSRPSSDATSTLSVEHSPNWHAHGSQCAPRRAPGSLCPRSAPLPPAYGLWGARQLQLCPFSPLIAFRCGRLSPLPLPRAGWGKGGGGSCNPAAGEQMVNGTPPPPHPGQITGL